MHRVAVMGAAGLAGGELLRILCQHPHLEVSLICSSSSEGQPVRSSHPHLAYAYRSRTFVSPEAVLEGEWDLIFLALPHGKSAPWVEGLMPLVEGGRRIVDLSGDFRLRDPREHEIWYGKHPCPQFLGSFVYGLPELNREKIASARLVSGVGCNATGVLLCLYPLVSSPLWANVLDVNVECRAGSSEGGSRPSEGGMHVFRSRAMRLVSPFVHRHMAEVVQELNIPAQSLSMTLTAVEAVRGVQCLAHVRFKDPVSEADLWRACRGAFGSEPFVDLCPARPVHLRIPDPKLVLGSNRAMVGFVLDRTGRRLLIGSGIDNLMKGAAGTAVQCANLMLGLPEDEGLAMPPVYPA
ncbi:N-acetyl-gamma-glutamyl-phosphate reductase, common form [Thermanaerovibrio velox DSM 12556]|uniref:N-acetyl-gamma-glutamyl-phosphate reductase n=1 Tax=Thermanaerovibrio velox DSM 12556 TaxID=926567 RepID=H0UNR5_9BACT|nr:N-acetyl-gamma-glutamyl-phosphate reductase [Thermanaerovibrio velox]EHM10480.1 N-acetyl-gamma-glutamyl-phosphate reductase, common form [Thermanaerovibrio velox DSM 12556]